MILKAIAVKEGNVYPPWWYGFAWHEFFADQEIWLPIPYNYIARWLRLARMRWDKTRAVHDRFTARVRRMAIAGEKLSYWRGYEHGLLQGYKHYEILHQESIKHEKRKSHET